MVERLESMSLYAKGNWGRLVPVSCFTFSTFTNVFMPQMRHPLGLVNVSGGGF